MAANPRKFSEKIALMRAKEVEGDAAFHQIIGEVSGITKTPDTHILPYAGLKNLIPHGTPPYAPYKGGSLPNINHSLQQQQQLQQQRQHSPNQNQSPQQPPANLLTGSPGIDLKSAIHDLNSLNGGDVSRRRFLPPQYGNGGVVPMRPQRNRASEHAPYSPYLTPHPLSASDWKKFKSDSDIHGSVKQQTHSMEGSTNSGLISPMIHRRVLEVGGAPNSPMSLSGNPNSANQFPDAGGFALNGMPTMPPHMGHVGVPLHHQMSLPHASHHHGSLPDLSNLGFTSNSPIPLLANISSHGPCSPPNDGFGRVVSTSMPPPDSPSSMRPSNGRHQSPLVGSPTHIQGIPQHFQYFPQPGVPMHSLGGIMTGPPPAHLTNSNSMSHSIPIAPQQSPKSPANLDKELVNQTIRRRINDKMLAQQQAQQYRQNSENVPSPSSPGTPPIRSPESVGGNSQHGDGMNYALSPGSHSSLQQQFDQVKMESHSPGINSNHFTNGNLTDSPFIHDHRPPMKQQSIPNIVLTGVDDNYGQFFDKEFRSTMSMSDSFDANDMFGGDEQFRSDLTPIDLADLQMLDDSSNVLTDPGTEDQLRL